MLAKLKEAFERVELLSEEEQEALADRILETLNAEDRVWDELFARPEVLAALQALGDEAIAADRRGETIPLEDLL